MKKRLQLLSLSLLSVVLMSYGQSASRIEGRAEKSTVIIKSMHLTESWSKLYTSNIQALKGQLTGKDSLKLIEIEKQLSDEAVTKKINSAFDQYFSNEDIDVLYNFVQTETYKKINMGQFQKTIRDQFKDIEQEINTLKQQLTESESTAEVTEAFEPIAVDRKNGFYQTVDYDHSAPQKDVKLEAKPSLTFKDVSTAKKEYSARNHQTQILLTLTKDGALKFRELTKNNIGRPIALVIAKHIIFMPNVNSEITTNQVIIAGNFSDEETEQLFKQIIDKKE